MFRYVIFALFWNALCLLFRDLTAHSSFTFCRETGWIERSNRVWDTAKIFIWKRERKSNRHLANASKRCKDSTSLWWHGSMWICIGFLWMKRLILCQSGRGILEGFPLVSARRGASRKRKIRETWLLEALVRLGNGEFVYAAVPSRSRLVLFPGWALHNISGWKEMLPNSIQSTLLLTNKYNTQENIYSFNTLDKLDYPHPSGARLLDYLFFFWKLCRIYNLSAFLCVNHTRRLASYVHYYWEVELLPYRY